ncbi:S1 RNA-binding domain-containing protein [Alteromonas gracilis]|uniref:CvfB family protein n=1 Tax=Alteromonas gracilis TaxID=1479524 RepID=UPI003736D226
MINIGKINTLRVVAQYPFGYALAPLVEKHDEQDSVIEIDDADDQQTVTLAIDEVETSLVEGQQIDVFVGTDQRGDLYATMKKPLTQVGETKVLKAVSATNFGAFFDWGLDNDLLIPNDYQTQPVNPGMYYVVHTFFDDKTQRILGATKLHYFLKESSAYLNEGDTVQCLVYAKTDLGFKVVINEKSLGLIFHSDAFKPLKVGQATDGVIKTIREDGKVDVALQRVDKGGRDALQQAILDDLEAHGGISTLTDKSAPEAIYSHFNVSKAAYKKALGALYKQKKITLSPDAVRLNK